MSLDEVDGIGVKTIELLNKIGIENVVDLISFYPRRYDVLKKTDMRFIKDGDKVVIDGVVECNPTLTQISFKLKKIIFRISNEVNFYQINAFNLVYLCRDLKIGNSVIVIGKYDRRRNVIVASEVRKGKLSDEVIIEPIYATTEGLSRKTIQKFVANALKKDLNIIDYIPKYLIDKYCFPEKKWSIEQIHNPKDSLSFKKAKQRLKYEELFWYLFRIHYYKKFNQEDTMAIERKFDENLLSLFIDRLPFSLTVGQVEAVKDIKSDLLSKKRMNRLVQGDVGSGKTIVAFLACYMNFLSGYQTALMVPTEILANQHYQNALSLFEDIGIKICLLTSSISPKKKRDTLKGISEGKFDFIIGTQSLIQDQVNYFNLGLIITDEQHRFGVNQRNKLKEKGIYPDILSMSATPIPRTYALTIYGDMDVSSIKTKPKGRKEVITFCRSYKEITEVLSMMKKELDLGHQIYVIAPSIENDMSKELDNVLILKEKLLLALGKLATIEVVHGKLLNEDKNRIMKSFEDGLVKILISTTVIEVGVNVPNASMIVIFQANLFGLSTLHQLRGRVGRGNIQSYCILLSKEKCERLEMLEHTNDGFEISEYDFKSRGEGDLFGIRQSGEAEFKLADIKKDFDLLVRVKCDVEEFFENYCDDEYLQNVLK